MAIGRIFVKEYKNIIFYNIVKNNEFKRTNTLILSRLIFINKTPTALNKETCKPIFNHKIKSNKKRGLTIEQNLQLKEGNIYFRKKLSRQTSCFNLDQWKDDYKRAQHYKKNICSFPSIDFRKTFQNYFDKESDRFKSNFSNKVNINS